MMVDLLLRELSHQLVVYVLHKVCTLIKLLLWSPLPPDITFKDVYNECRTYQNAVSNAAYEEDCTIDDECTDHVDGPTVNYRFYTSNPLVYMLNNTDRNLYSISRCSNYALYRQNIAMAISWFLHYTYNTDVPITRDTYKEWLNYLKEKQDCIAIGLLGPQASMLHTDKVLTAVSNTLCWHAIFHDTLGRFYQCTKIGPGYRYTSKTCNIRFKSNSLFGHTRGIYKLSRDTHIPLLHRLYNNGDISLDINKYVYPFYYASKCVTYTLTPSQFLSQFAMWIYKVHM